MKKTVKPRSEAEHNALRFLQENGGSVLITAIPEKTIVDVLGYKVAGIRVYQQLEKAGLLYITEEEPCEDGFVFTQMVELTPEGWLSLKL